MTEFNPDSITQDELHKLRNAAEKAWSDETRDPIHEGHPLSAFGQCYVTSRWLTSKLGGHVGIKDGHYIWVSPDKNYVIDLTGELFARRPVDLKYAGIKMDEEDSGWIPREDQKQYLPGPILYKKADHPLYKGMRIKTVKTENPRYKIFKERADKAYADS